MHFVVLLLHVVPYYFYYYTYLTKDYFGAFTHLNNETWFLPLSPCFHLEMHKNKHLFYRHSSMVYEHIHLFRILSAISLELCNFLVLAWNIGIVCQDFARMLFTSVPPQTPWVPSVLWEDVSLPLPTPNIECHWICLQDRATVRNSTKLLFYLNSSRGSVKNNISFFILRAYWI